MDKGVFAGYPLSNVRVIVYDGKEHPVDSKPIAFETAGREAFKLAVLDAGPVLFEPIMNVQISVPEENMGDIIGDFNRRRGQITGMESQATLRVVLAHVPLAEMFGYVTVLRTMSSGRATSTMEFSHYDIIPPALSAEVIEKITGTKVVV